MSRSHVDCAELPCPVCAGRRFEHLFVLAEENFVRCHGCTLMMINPPPHLSTSAATYDETYSQGYITKADKKLKRCRRWVAQMQRRYVSTGRWLDVGCSAGFVVKAASAAGFDAHGVEVEPAAVAYGRDTLNLKNLRCGYLEDQAYDTGSFDVISLYDVIEHVPDLNRIIAELHRILALKGVVEIRTPNVAHWKTPRDLSTWKEVKPSEHLYYFSARTLTELFENHGFRLRHKRFMLNPALDMFFCKSAM